MKKEGIIKKDIKVVEKELGLIERKIWKYVFHFHYIKILLLIVFVFLSYILFKNNNVQDFLFSFGELEYIGMFVAGILFTFGFTAPFAVGFFVILNPVNPLIVAVVGGFGALLGNLLIFYFIRFTFMDEFKRLEKTRVIKKIRQELKIHLNHKVRLYLLYTLVGVIMASPIPDEVGVIMLAGLTHVKLRVIAIISFIFATLGIFILCVI